VTARVAVLVALAAGRFFRCGSDAPTGVAVADAAPERPGITDASLDVDLGTDASSADGCTQDLRVDPTCVHPMVTKNCSNGWCTIPAGCFIMGSPLCEKPRALRAEPQTQTTLTRSFVIQQHELTAKDWTRFGWPNPAAGVVQSGFRACESQDCPVAYVQLHEAMAYANRLSEAEGRQQCYRLITCTGEAGKGLLCDKVEQTTASVYECRGYRLPTEAEWEYAYRAGTRTGYYSGPSTPLELGCAQEPPAAHIGWYCNNAGNVSHPVGLKMANAWGLFDMAGNAAEFTSNAYTPAGYGSGALVDPFPSLPEGKRLVTRGGAFSYDSATLKASLRFEATLGLPTVLNGFRLVRTLP
jgi:formylglycine-generating enzyme